MFHPDTPECTHSRTAEPETNPLKSKTKSQPKSQSKSRLHPQTKAKAGPKTFTKPAPKAAPKLTPKKPKVFLDKATKAWIDTVISLGKLPRGSDLKELQGLERLKAIFRVNKRSVFELWEVYTQRRDELSRKLINNRAYTVSYLLGFHLPNVARTMDLMTRSNKRHHWNKLCAANPVRLYDIGCGTAAMSSAYVQAAKASEVFLYDSSGPLLDAAAKMHEHLGTKNLRTSRVQIEDLKRDWFQSTDPNTVHVYLLGYVWNELHRNNPARRRLFEILAAHIERNEKALLFIAEPALEHMSRPAMELRDILCSQGYQALYPCPTSNACPMLERPKDWCYSEGAWEQPEIASWIDEKLDLDRRRHASTIFAFATPATGLKSDNQSVVVGRPVKEAGLERYKGHFDYLICDGKELVKRAPKQPKHVVLRGTSIED